MATTPRAPADSSATMASAIGARRATTMHGRRRAAMQSRSNVAATAMRRWALPMRDVYLAGTLHKPVDRRAPAAYRAAMPATDRASGDRAAGLMLLTTPVIWGLTFPAAKLALAHVD